MARLVSVIAAAGIGAALLTSSAGAAQGRPFHLALSGAQEFDAAGRPTNAHGDAERATMTLTLNPGKQLVCWTVHELVLTEGETLPHLAHIHKAPAGFGGPVVVDLFRGAAPTSYPTDTRCVSADRAVILKILRDPAAYYVNLHNAQHPAGVVRAQLK